MIWLCTISPKLILILLPILYSSSARLHLTVFSCSEGIQLTRAIFWSMAYLLVREAALILFFSKLTLPAVCSWATCSLLMLAEFSVVEIVVKFMNDTFFIWFNVCYYSKQLTGFGRFDVLACVPLSSSATAFPFSLAVCFLSDFLARVLVPTFSDISSVSLASFSLFQLVSSSVSFCFFLFVFGFLGGATSFSPGLSAIGIGLVTSSISTEGGIELPGDGGSSSSDALLSWISWNGTWEIGTGSMMMVAGSPVYYGTEELSTLSVCEVPLRDSCLAAESGCTVNLFTAGLDEVLRIDVERNRPSSLDEAINVAMDYAPLVDMSSTHNFINAMAATHLHLPITRRTGLQVAVANGEPLSSLGICEQVLLQAETFSFLANLFVIPLSGVELILGIKWLRTLEPVWWDFETLQMSFVEKRLRVALSGISAACLPALHHLHHPVTEAYALDALLAEFAPIFD
nr:Aspartic peptidase [Ipomoea batatas]